MFAVRALSGILILSVSVGVVWAALKGAEILFSSVGKDAFGMMIAAPVIVFFAYLIGEGAADFAKARARYKVK